VYLSAHNLGLASFDGNRAAGGRDTIRLIVHDNNPSLPNLWSFEQGISSFQGKSVDAALFFGSLSRKPKPLAALMRTLSFYRRDQELRTRRSKSIVNHPKITQKLTALASLLSEGSILAPTSMQRRFHNRVKIGFTPVEYDQVDSNLLL
jgi:hypothetical protein